MRLSNETSAIAYLHAVNLLEPELRAALIVKKTYVLASDRELTAATDPLPLVADQLVTDFGHFHGEVFFRKRGVDICVLGTVRLDAPVRQSRLRIEVGAWSHELNLFGDRFWTRDRNGAVIPSSPAPFQEMPLSYARSFGGVAQFEGEDVPWSENPIGRGYYETPEQAIGGPLPNIELVHSPAERRWNTRIPVAGWGPYPNYWALRASRAVAIDSQTGEVLDISPEIFNHAHPDLILEHVDPGAPVLIKGLRTSPIMLAVPRERPHVQIDVGGAVSEAFGEIDGLFVWTDAARVVVTWRARFRYPVRPEEVRRAVLTFRE